MDLILWVLEQEDDLHYYQGYHDICVTVLQVCGARLGTGFDLILIRIIRTVWVGQFGTQGSIGGLVNQ